MPLGSLKLLVQDVKGRVVGVELAAWNVEQESLRFSKANARLAAEVVSHQIWNAEGLAEKMGYLLTMDRRITHLLLHLQSVEPDDQV